VRFLLMELKRELEQLAIYLEETDALIQRAAQESEPCQHLDAIPRIGPLTATALIAANGSGAAFRKGREFAARVGLVPCEHSTGGKQKLLGISKRGTSYLRRLFIQGTLQVGAWMGLDPDDTPLMLHDVDSDYIYALTLDEK
jgi:transposase